MAVELTFENFYFDEQGMLSPTVSSQPPVPLAKVNAWWVYVYVHLKVYFYMHIYVFVYVWVYVYLLFICIYMYLCMYECMYIYI